MITEKLAIARIIYRKKVRYNYSQKKIFVNKNRRCLITRRFIGIDFFDGKIRMEDY